MIIKLLTANDLKRFIDSDEYKCLEVIPITRHRALSHINNPRIDNKDIILLCAYEDEKLIGYLGILADYIYLNNKKHKVGWLSCLWIDSAVRRKGISKILLNRAFDSWENKIIITQFTPAAKLLYDRSELFFDLKMSEGIRCYLRFNLHELLPQKMKSLKKIYGIIKFTDRFFNLFNEIRLLFWKPFLKLSGIKLEFVNEIDNEINEFIIKRMRNGMTRREDKELNWIIRYPWVITSPLKDRYSERYFFSSIDDFCLFSNIKVYDNDNQMIGFLMLAIRGNNLKIPYCYFDEKYTEIIITILYKYMFNMNLNMFTTFNNSLLNYLRSHRTPFLHKRRMKRYYMISKVFKNNLYNNKINFQDGDGDCAFT